MDYRIGAFSLMDAILIEILFFIGSLYDSSVVLGILAHTLTRTNEQLFSYGQYMIGKLTYF